MDRTNTVSSTSDNGMAEQRKSQLIKGAVALFKNKGFHRTTVGEIAEFSGVSTGTLYEYIETKEEILFLVSDSICDYVKAKLLPLVSEKNPDLSNIQSAIEVYFKIIDEMQDEVVVMYQELKSLPKEARQYVLKKEKDMIGILEQVIVTNLSEEIEGDEISLIANNIFVQGQMWGFRRWMLQKEYTIDTYTKLQTKYAMNVLK